MMLWLIVDVIVLVMVILCATNKRAIVHRQLLVGCIEVANAVSCWPATIIIATAIELNRTLSARVSAIGLAGYCGHCCNAACLLHANVIIGFARGRNNHSATLAYGAGHMLLAFRGNIIGICRRRRRRLVHLHMLAIQLVRVADDNIWQSIGFSQLSIAAAAAI